MKCFYFGAWSRGHLGHFLYLPGGSLVGREVERQIPFATHILDSGLLPQVGSQTQCVVHRSVINGWTVLTFWDRSGDSRGSSNSSFILQGEHATEAGLAFARELFPTVFARFTFPLVVAEAKP